MGKAKAKVAAWNALPSEVQEDLIKWYNVAKPTDDDRELLADLYNAGRFDAWDCPDCEDRVRKGDPESWDDFQGVCQPDYVSYPGDSEKYQPGYLAKLCDFCRAHP